MGKKDFFTETLGMSFEDFQKEAGTNSSSGNFSKSASSGNSSKSASSGDYSTSASSGNSSKSASSGDFSKSASSGNSSTSASSGDFSTSASSGNHSTSSCDGKYSSATANGYFSAVMGTTDRSVICAIEFNKDYQPVGAAFGIVGEDIEPNKYYIAHEGKLKEMIEVDGIKSILLSRKGNVMKVLLDEFSESYIVTDGTNYAHGKTIKEARESLVYKISNRDKSEFEYLTMDSVLTFKEAIEAYRVITGACAFGVKNFIESKGIKKKKYKVSEIVDITKGAYGHEDFKQFINNNNNNNNGLTRRTSIEI